MSTTHRYGHFLKMMSKSRDAAVYWQFNCRYAEGEILYDLLLTLGWPPNHLNYAPNLISLNQLYSIAFGQAQFVRAPCYKVICKVIVVSHSWSNKFGPLAPGTEWIANEDAKLTDDMQDIPHLRSRGSHLGLCLQGDSRSCSLSLYGRRNRSECGEATRVRPQSSLQCVVIVTSWWRCELLNH